jgi:hypothetical protein
MGLKIWEHYGYGTTYKILKKNNRQNTTSVRVRTSLTASKSSSTGTRITPRPASKASFAMVAKSRFGNSRSP